MKARIIEALLGVSAACALLIVTLDQSIDSAAAALAVAATPMQAKTKITERLAPSPPLQQKPLPPGAVRI